MKYKKLDIPKDSAWDRKTWRYYTPIWFNRFVEGVQNIIKWIPVVYKDKNWDHSYIYGILEFKLLQQRNCLVKANRFEGTETVNRDITICLNLIDRIKEDYYGVEYHNYFEWKGVNGEDDFFNFDYEWENFDEFFKKYPNQYRKALKENDESDKWNITCDIASSNHKRAKKLLYRILNEKLDHWWD